MSNGVMIINSSNVSAFAEDFSRDINKLANDYDNLVSIVTKEAHESGAPYVQEILEDMRSVSYAIAQERDKAVKMVNLLVEDVLEFDRVMGK